MELVQLYRPSRLFLCFALLMVHPGGMAMAAAGGQQAAQAMTKVMAKKIADPLIEPLQIAKHVAHDEDVIRLLAGSDNGALEQKMEDLNEHYPALLKLRLLRRGSPSIDMSASPPFGYASIAMLRQAETTTGAVPIELHLNNSPGQHLALVERVKDGSGKLLGFVHLSLSSSYLPSALASIVPAQGYAELRQSLMGNQVVVIAKAGRLSQQNTRPLQAAVPWTQWTLAYWPPPVSGLEEISSGVIPLKGLTMGALAVFLTAAIATVVVILKRRKRQSIELDEDATVYQGAVKAFIDGEHPALEHLVPQLPKRSQGRKSREAEVLEKTREMDRAPILTTHIDTPFDGEITQVLPKQTLAAADAAPTAPVELISDSIFRAYDIRGIVGETLTLESVYRLGRAIGSEVCARQQASIVMGRDGRASSPDLAGALQRGLVETGIEIIDIGMVPTPVLYFATHFLNTDNGVMITGSHNPPNYNGLKIVLEGRTLAGDELVVLQERINKEDYVNGMGSLRQTDIGTEYIRQITEDIAATLGKPLKVAVDCGNGVAGMMAPNLIRALGHDVIELYCEVDGNFPHHHPDPSQPENLQELIATVKSKKADLGLAFDGDGDRLGVVDGQGNIIWPDRLLMLFARDILSRQPGAEIIFDVKCSNLLSRDIEQHGGKPLLWKTGHSLIKTKMRETDAPLAGEMSGHIFFKERWYGFDDALYASARLLELLDQANRTPARVFAELPYAVSTPELRLALPEDRHAEFMAELIANSRFPEAEMVTVDGLRLNFTDGWGLVRPSNTTPHLVLRFEGDNQAALERIQENFRQLLWEIDASLNLPF